jgi:hypothetical protein
MESVESMIAIVQIYINYRTEQQVNIKVNTFQEIRKLKEAYNIAKEWLHQFNMQIIERNL